MPQINKALAAGAVPVTALSSDGLKTLSQGHLALVNNAVDQASGDISMKATFENTDNVLWPGLSVSTRLLVDTLKQVTVVPDGRGRTRAERPLRLRRRRRQQGRDARHQGRSGGRWTIGRLEGSVARRERGDGGPIPIAAKALWSSRARRVPRRRPATAPPNAACEGALTVAGSISEPFIRHPIATSLLMVGILFVGIIAYPRLPVAPLPQVDFPTIQVSAQLPGASPDTMASAVAQPLETQFAQISGVSQMTSTSTLGSTAITIQFDLDRDIDGGVERRAGGDQRRQRAIAEESAEPADLSQGQSGGFAHSPARRDLRTRCR